MSNNSKQYHNNNQDEFELEEKKRKMHGGQPLDKFPGFTTTLFGIVLPVAEDRIRFVFYWLRVKLSLKLH